MSKAKDNYKMWHAKNPSKEYVRSIKQLDEKNAFPIGIATEILYASAKWETESFDYVHDFGSPKIYLVASQVDPGEAVGPSRSVNALINTKSKKTRPEMALLGTVKRLQYKDKDGFERVLSGVRGAQLLCTPDKKGLLILTKAGPVFVRGGKMRVTSRGIVD